MKYLPTALLITIIAIPLLSLAQTNKALNFNGDSYVDLGNVAANQVRTIELWFMANEKIDPSLNDYQTVIAREVNAINEDEFSLWFRPSATASEAGTLTFRFSDDVNNQYRIFSDDNTWESGIWHHVAVVIDPVIGMRMFIDGVLQQSTHSHTQAITTRSETTTLGALKAVGMSPIRHFNGKIDEVRLSTDVEYTTNFTPPCPNHSPTPATTGLWQFEEGNGSIAIDSSGIGNDGVISGARYVKACICGNGDNLFFDGQGAYVDLGTSVGNNVRSIELWVKPYEEINPSNPDYQTLVAREVNAVNEDEFSLWFLPAASTNAGKIAFRYSDDINNQYRVHSDTSLWKAGVWYHVAVVIDPGSGTSMYIDGQKQSETHSNAKATATINEPTTVGAFSTSVIRQFYGQIEDLHFSSSPLYANNFTPPCPNRQIEASTLGLWHFNEGSGNKATDAGTLGYDGTIYAPAYACDTICTANLSLTEKFSRQQIRVYPNPASSRIFVELDGLGGFPYIEGKVQVISSEGKTVFSQKLKISSNKFELSLPKNIGAGLYVIQVRHQNGGFYSKKFTIDH
jgi:hypothetical protein